MQFWYDPCVTGKKIRCTSSSHADAADVALGSGETVE